MRISICDLLLLAMLTGCATHVTLPLRVRHPATVYLTDYGRHSSILLPTAHGYEEYGYGDWRWFALGDNKWWNAIHAMLGSSQATLGRRSVAIAHGRINIDDLPGCVRLTEFQAEEDRADSLMLTLEAAFRRASEKPLHSTYSGLNHVVDLNRYYAFHNCNHATAQWLRDLGCKTSGPAILSNFEMDLP